MCTLAVQIILIKTLNLSFYTKLLFFQPTAISIHNIKVKRVISIRLTERYEFIEAVNWHKMKIIVHN